MPRSVDPRQRIQMVAFQECCEAGCNGLVPVQRNYNTEPLTSGAYTRFNLSAGAKRMLAYSGTYL